MKKVYLFCCTLSSLSISVWIFAIKKSWTINFLLSKINIEWKLPIGQSIDLIISGIIYFGLTLLYAWITTLGFKALDSDNIKYNQIVSIRPSGNKLMLTYFGLFFFALSANSGIVFLFAFLILAFAVYYTSRELYNPLYIFLGYRFYGFKVGRKELLVLSRKRYKEGDMLESIEVRSINSYTLVDINKD